MTDITENPIPETPTPDSPNIAQRQEALALAERRLMAREALFDRQLPVSALSLIDLRDETRLKESLSALNSLWQQAKTAAPPAGAPPIPFEDAASKATLSYRQRLAQYLNDKR